MCDIYNEIYNLCKVRNKGNVYRNTKELTPRLKFITELLSREGIKYEVDSNKSSDTYVHNLILRGSSDKMVVAHHDVQNYSTDNANDNSASVINAIALKKIIPSVNVVLLDGEEVGGLGSKQLAQQINNNYFGDIKWVLNLELTGLGGKNFFIGNYKGELYNHIKGLFDCPVYNTIFNDSVIFRQYGIDSTVINPLPSLPSGLISNIIHNGVYLDDSILFDCHTKRDTIDKISTSDMKVFVEDILVQILK
jgi:hypothetical protein